MSTRNTTIFYVLLIAVASMAVGMVIASRLDLTPASSAQTMALPAMNSAPITGPLDAQTFRNIAKAQTPMVVSIATVMKTRRQDLTEFFGTPDDFFHRFFGTPPGRNPDQEDEQGGGRGRRRNEPKAMGSGSGFIISRDGLILTNNHVVEDATEIRVSLFAEDDPDAPAADAKVVGRDPLTDSALIELVDKPKMALPEARFGDSGQVAAGDWVMAIGNPFGYQHTVTVGVISATGRSFTVSPGRPNEMLQTDAAINPGNSGGPLLNLRGEVIGINTAIATNARSEGNIGIGFAVPINAVRELLPQLRQGKVVRGRIGVEVRAVPRDDYQEQFGLKSRAGALVATVASGGAAKKAGIEPGDVITEYNGRPVTKTEDLVRMVVHTTPGTTVPVRVVHNKQEKTVSVTVEELDLEAEQSALTGRGRDTGPESPQEQAGSGFGISLRDLTPQMARRLQVPGGQGGAFVADLDPDGPAAGALLRGDVILSVNRKPVSTAAEAARELDKVASGHIANMIVWRNNNETFVTVKKQ